MQISPIYSYQAAPIMGGNLPKQLLPPLKFTVTLKGVSAAESRIGAANKHFCSSAAAAPRRRASFRLQMVNFHLAKPYCFQSVVNPEEKG